MSCALCPASTAIIRVSHALHAASMRQRGRLESPQSQPPGLKTGPKLRPRINSMMVLETHSEALIVCLCVPLCSECIDQWLSRNKTCAICKVRGRTSIQWKAMSRSGLVGPRLLDHALTHRVKMCLLRVIAFEQSVESNLLVVTKPHAATLSSLPARGLSSTRASLFACFLFAVAFYTHPIAKQSEVFAIQLINTQMTRLD